MQHLAAFNLLESIAQITEEKNKKSLERALLQTLKELLPSASFAMLFVPRNFNGKNLELHATSDEYHSTCSREGSQVTVPCDDLLHTCIISLTEQFSKQDGGGRLAVPIRTQKVLTHIVEVYNYDESGDSNKIIKAFASIYGNFLSLLHDNEHDALTGLLNRKTFSGYISELQSEGRKTLTDSLPENVERRDTGRSQSHWIGVLDIDHFKRINDTYGHIYGDEVLLLFANIMRQTFRADDLLFRFGGEEFVVLLMNSARADALCAFERFRVAVEQYDFPRVGKATVSIGLTELDPKDYSHQFLEHADQALYYAKEHGRNQTCEYQSLVDRKLINQRIVEADIELF